MRWPLRNQVFLPFAILISLTVIVVTIVNARNSVRLQRDREFDRMKQAAQSLADANFPLTPDIVSRVSGMFDGEIVIVNDSDSISASTLGDDETLAAVLSTLDVFETDALEPQFCSWNDEQYIVGAVLHRGPRERGTLFVLRPRARLDRVIRDSLATPILVAIPTLVIGLLLAMLVSRRVGGRVERLQDHFGKLAAGEFQTIDVGSRNDEIGDLMTSANELSDRLKRMQEELVRVERLELLGQLSGGLAHQLRNSITGARLSIQMHERSCGDGGSEMLKTALAQLKLTEEQVQAVLSLRTNPNAVEPQKADLKQLVIEVIELLHPQTSHWNTSVSNIAKEDDDFSKLFVSPSSIKGALLNVGMNAVQAAGVDGKVEFVTYADDESLSVEVRDSGPGFRQRNRLHRSISHDESRGHWPGPHYRPAFSPTGIWRHDYLARW